MFEVRAHVGKNLLQITLSGRVTADQVLQGAEEALRAGERLRPPFDVLSDVSRVEVFEPDAMTAFERGVQAAIRLGVRRVVRVVGRQTNVAVLLEKQARRNGYSAHLAFSREEAEALLSVPYLSADVQGT